MSCMLGRDSQESRRLDIQHGFTRRWGHGSLIHPSIPLTDLHTVADVGTGTGIWINEVAQLLNSNSRTSNCIGFDVSAEQFSPAVTRAAGVELEVHDVLEPFAEKFRGKFDLVNVRYLAYGMLEKSLLSVIKNLSELLRPGGYLQWQEVDIIDCWTHPSTESAREAISLIGAEKTERGIVLSLPSALVKAMLAVSTNLIEDGKLNTLNWNSDDLRVWSLDTVSTVHHDDAFVHEHKDAIGLAINTLLLRGAARRNRVLASDKQLSSSEREKRAKLGQKCEDIAQAIERETAEGKTSWDSLLTWIVARKANVLSKSEDWMNSYR
ncbi:hypothetical protein MMC17_006102 [Xylographa soralifera]|nr:hypothetical protein [Xylographa soralifera]